MHPGATVMAVTRGAVKEKGSGGAKGLRVQLSR